MNYLSSTFSLSICCTRKQPVPFKRSEYPQKEKSSRVRPGIESFSFHSSGRTLPASAICPARSALRTIITEKMMDRREGGAFALRFSTLFAFRIELIPLRTFDRVISLSRLGSRPCATKAEPNEMETLFAFSMCSRILANCRLSAESAFKFVITLFVFLLARTRSTTSENARRRTWQSDENSVTLARSLEIISLQQRTVRRSRQESR